jgi:hypothetical protein
MFHHHKIFGEGVQKRKEMIRIGEEHGKIGRRHCSALAGSMLFKEGYEMKTCHSNTHLSIYKMGDTSAFMIKGDVTAFVMGDGMGDAFTFVIKGDTSREMYVSFTYIIGDAQYERVSPFCQRSGCLRY